MELTRKSQRRLFMMAGIAVTAVTSVAFTNSRADAQASTTSVNVTNVIDHNPSCSLRTERIPNDPNHFLYIYSGKNPSKTMWVTTGPPSATVVTVHTFYAAGTFVAPASDFVQYPTINNWIPLADIFAKCPPPDTTTTTAEVTTTTQGTTTTTEPTPTTTSTSAPEPTTTTTAPTTTTSAPDEVVQFGCPTGQFVRFEFIKTSGPVVAGDSVMFTYLDSDGLPRSMGTVPNFEGRFLFTGTGTAADGLFNTATLVSVDTEGYQFLGFSCYQPVPTTDTTTSTTEAPTTTTSTTAIGVVTNGGFQPASVSPAVAVSPSHLDSLPFTGSRTRLWIWLGLAGFAAGLSILLFSRKVKRPVGS